MKKPNIISSCFLSFGGSLPVGPSHRQAQHEYAQVFQNAFERPRIPFTLVASHLRTSICAITALMLLPCVDMPSHAADNDPILRFYLSFEQDARDFYKKFEEGVIAERERKKRAGEPPLSADQQLLGMYAGRELTYNKVLFYPLCAEEGRESRVVMGLPFEQAKKELLDCVGKKTDQLFESGQLEKYVSVLGDRKFVACEVKARDFKSERRFPPFDFLRDPKGLRVIDYGKMNECIKSQL